MLQGSTRSKPFVALVAVMLSAGLLVGAPAGADPADDAALTLYVSSDSSGVVDGIAFGDEDVLAWDSTTDDWSMFFDGSAAGLPTAADIDALDVFSVSPAVQLMFSVRTPVTIPGAGPVDDSDVVFYDGTTFSVAFTGSELGLTTSSEDIDALAFVDDLSLVVSTVGGSTVPRSGGGVINGRDEDLLLFDGTGASYVIDGSDTDLAGEDIGGAVPDLPTGQWYLAFTGNYNTPDTSGDKDDVPVFTGTTGDPTSGTLAAFFDGDQHRFGTEQIDALDIRIGSAPPQAEADLSITKIDDIDPALPGNTVTYTIEVTNNGPDAAENVVVTDVLPAGTTLVATSGCALDPNGVPCSLGTIPASATASYTLAVSIDTTEAGILTNTATVSSAAIDNMPGNNSVSETTEVVTGPTADDDGPATDSAPGDPFHGETDQTLTLPNLLANDVLGDPPAQLISFGGGDFGFPLGLATPGSETVPGAGVLTVLANGDSNFEPDAGFGGLVTFEYRISGPGGTSDATVSLFIGPRPTAGGGGDTIYLSSSSSMFLPEVGPVADEDVVSFKPESSFWQLVLDLSDLGLASVDTNAVHRIDDDEFLLSFQQPVTVGGTTYDDSDVAHLVTTSTGDMTTGTFSMFFDGSNHDLTTSAEDIDAVSITADGKLVISTTGGGRMPAEVGELITRDEDLIVFDAETATFALLFDGSDVDLAGEDLSGGHVDPMTGQIYGAGLNGFSVPGLNGDGNDVFAFASTGIGETTAGTFNTYFDGGALNSTAEQIDGLAIDFGEAPNLPPVFITPDELSVSEATFALFDGGQLPQVDITATDPNGDTEDGGGITYAITGGVDFDTELVSLFDPDTGVLQPLYDFEEPVDANEDNRYELEITATDSGGLTTVQQLTLVITDLPEPDFEQRMLINGAPGPAVLQTGETFTVTFEMENVGALPLTWETLTTQPGQFPGIDLTLHCGLPGPVPVGDTASCDVEVVAENAPIGTSLIGVFLASSPGWPVVDDSLDEVTTVEYRTEDPPEITSGSEVTAPENQTAAYIVEATDPEGDTAGNGLTFAITGGADANDFGIDTNTGVITFNTAPDFEDPGDSDTNNRYEITVEVTDSQTLTDSQDVTIEVTDVAEITNSSWVRLVESPESDFPYDVAVDDGGNVFTTGVTEADEELIDSAILLVKHDTEGAELWRHSLGAGTASSGNAVTVDAESNVYVAGYFGGSVDFDPGPSTTMLTSDSGSLDGFVAKFDTDGNLLWVNGFGGAGFDVATDLVLDNSGRVWVTGTFDGTVDFDPGPAVSSMAGSNDLFLVSYGTTDGALVSPQSLSGSGFDHNARVALDSAGNLVLTGTFSGTIDLDFDAGGVLHTSAIPSAFVAKYDTDLILQWSHVLPFSLLNGVDVDAGNNVLLAGYFDGTEDFDPDPVDVDSLTSIGLLSVVLVKLDSTGDHQWANRIGSSGVDLGLDVAVDPNGNIGVTGILDEVADLDPGPGVAELPADIGDDALFAIYDSSGGFLWGRRYTGGTFVRDSGNAITFDDQGNVYGVGSFNGTATFDPNGSLTETGDDGGFVTKFRPEAPTLTAPLEVTVAEGTLVAHDLSTVDDTDAEGSGLTYSIGGGDDGVEFGIDATTGEITFNTAPDFEIPGDLDTNNRYEVTVSVTDSDTNTHSLAITIVVTDVAEPGTVGGMVWSDDNNDGLQTPGEAPVPAVTVNLLSSDLTLIDTAVTDGAGLYSFTQADLDRSRIVEFIPLPATVFSPQDQGIDETLDSDPDTATGRVAVTFQDGVTDDTVDAGLWFFGD